LRTRYNISLILFPKNCVITDFAQQLAAQTTQIDSLDKHPIYADFVTHLIGPQGMVMTNGSMWKKSRSLFNPGFSLPHLMTLVPTIVDQGLIYFRKIGEHADSGEVRPIDEDLAHLTIDIMGHVILDVSLKSQTEKNDFVDAFQRQISWTPSANSINPLAGLNPIRPFAQRYYTRKMNNYVEKVLDDRYASSNGASSKSRRKPAIDLALDEYTQQQKDEKVAKNARGIDKAFKTNAIDQMKTFIFAGSDTTSSTMAFSYLLLNQYPEELVKARAELDSVFGPDSRQTGELIKQNPNLVNSLQFISGVLKEVLRLYPPAMSVREGKGKITYEGVEYDINGYMIFEDSHAIQRNADYFPSPDEFIPERWISGSDRFHDVPKDAYRPFEKGPRDCIGQQLAMLEMKIILALTLRDFDFQEDYETWDRKLGRKNPGTTLDGRRGMFGE
jgi:cytochrome P450